MPMHDLSKDMIHMHPSASHFGDMLNLARSHAAACIEESFNYNQQRWDKTHKKPEFKIGDLVLVSTLNFKWEGPRKLKDSFVGPFVIKALHRENAVEVIFTGDFDRKHPTFPVSLIKPYVKSDKDKLPIRNDIKVNIPPYQDLTRPDV